MTIFDAAPDLFEVAARRLDPGSNAFRNLKLFQGATLWPLVLEKDVRNKDLRGKNALITGGNQGIGFYTILYLVQRGCNVFICCRDNAPGEPSAKETLKKLSIEKKRSDQVIEIWTLDCSSLDSVKKLAERFLQTKRPLHYLFCNAGICRENLVMTAEGFELHWIINFLSHFCLTLLLLPALKAADKARIVNVASCFHYFGDDIDWSKLNSLESEQWSGVSPHLMKYGRSKLAMCMFGRELNNRLLANESTRHIVVHSLHPGAIYSDMWRGLFAWDTVTRAMRTTIVWSAGQISLTPYTGSRSVIKAALSDEDDRDAVGGHYYNRGWKVSARPEIDDAKAREKLWAMCLKDTGLSADII